MRRRRPFVYWAPFSSGSLASWLNLRKFKRMIKVAALGTAFFGFLISAFCYFRYGFEFSLSCLFGMGIMLINLLGLWILWRLIFSKKSIALVLLVIIFKYLILGLILWNLNQIQWMRPLGFILGLSSLVFGILTTLVIKKFFAVQL